MRTLELQHFGLDGLQQVTRDEPEPGPGEVRVRMQAASLNYHDLAAVLGMANPKMQCPRIPLSDGAGEIDAVGAGVTDRQVGERVTSLFFPDWQGGRPTFDKMSRVTGDTIDGVMADAMVVPASAVMPVPEHLSQQEAATLPCAALTAWRALMDGDSVRSGDRVLLQGTGGVSLFALQLCKLLGAETYMVSSSRDKLDRVAPLEPDHWLSYKDEPEWGRAVRKLAGGSGVDRVIEVGGAGTLTQSLKALAVGGHVAMIGVLTGPAAPVETARMMALNARVEGLTVGSRDDFAAMNRALAQHRVRPCIGETLGFGDLRSGLEAMQAARHVGKIVFDFDK
jgi:NADPH:quinone reductase-like Zn-dependent oxidoreductase